MADLERASKPSGLCQPGPDPRADEEVDPSPERPLRPPAADRQGADAPGRRAQQRNDQHCRTRNSAMTNPALRKAVFPVAGLGTRLLPATKSMPKEMLTIVDRPLIQYAVDEAREAGIEQMIFVTGRGKSSLVDYFDMGFELETTMSQAGKSLDSLAAARSGFGEIVAVRQQQPLGL